MNTKAKRLPAKLSDLIEVAVKDLSAVERSRKYKVDMGVYHVPDNESCRVCLAGAVIAKHLGAEIDCNYSPFADFPEPVATRLHALDAVRTNDLYTALAEINSPRRRSQGVLARDDLPTIPAYSKRKSPLFKRALRRLAKILREEGL